MALSSVYHKLYDKRALRAAARYLNRRAAPGVDGETWEDWKADETTRVALLSSELARQTYRPKPLLPVDIPKADGSARSIELPCFVDKVAQGAFVGLLREFWRFDDVDLIFGERSRGAARRACAWRRRARWYVRVDVADFFPSVDRKRLLAILSRRFTDRRVVRLAGLWMPGEGLPQGLVCSPALAAVYLQHVYDHWWRSERRPGWVGTDRFADDIVAGFGSSGDAVEYLSSLEAQLRGYGLAFKQSKVLMGRVSEGIPFLGLRYGRERVTTEAPMRRRDGFDESIGVLRYYQGVGVGRTRLRPVVRGLRAWRS